MPTKSIMSRLALKAASKAAHKIHDHAHNHGKNGGKQTLADVSDKASKLYKGKGAGKGSKSPGRRGLAKVRPAHQTSDTTDPTRIPQTQECPP